MSSRRVWYCLVDTDGNAFRGAGVDAAMISGDSLVIDLRSMIFAQNSNILREYAPSQLSVYANREDLCSERIREEDIPLYDLGMTKTSPVYVRVPDEAFQKRQRFGDYHKVTSMNICTEFLPEFREDRLKISGNVVDVITLKADWLMGSGIGKVISDESSNPRVVDTMLYIRKLCLDQISFMANLVCNKYGIGLIHGQPGTGKSNLPI